MTDARIDAAIRRARHGRRVARWRSEDARTVARALIEQHRGLAAADGADIEALVDAIGQRDDDMAPTFVIMGKVEVRVTGKRIVAGRETYHTSPVMPGLWRRRDMPREEDVHERAREAVNRQLGKRTPVVAARVIDHGYGSEALQTMLTVRTPERAGETYEIQATFEHQPRDEFDKAVRATADLIRARERHRVRILAEREKVEAAIASKIEKVDGMRVVGSVYRIEAYKLARDGTFSGNAYATVEMTGPSLTPRTVTIGIEEDDRHLKTLIARHRANLRRLGDRDAETALGCDPILANAIADLDDRYAGPLLREIEGALAGGYRNPSNPRLRRISNVTVANGVVRAPVALDRRVRHHKGRVNAKDVKTLPQTMLAAMVGRPITDVIEHPWLKGMTIKTAMINTYGLQLRPNEVAVPLEPVLETLRAKARRHQDEVDGRNEGTR